MTSASTSPGPSAGTPAAGAEGRDTTPVRRPTAVRRPNAVRRPLTPALAAVVRRLGQALTTLVGGGIITFGLLVAAPGDPADRVLQARGVAEPTHEVVAQVRRELGLDRSLPLRFGSWLADLLRGDLGVSWRTGRPVVDEFAERLPATLILTGTALALPVALSLGFGLLAAARPGGAAPTTRPGRSRWPAWSRPGSCSRSCCWTWSSCGSGWAGSSPTAPGRRCSCPR